MCSQIPDGCEHNTPGVYPGAKGELSLTSVRALMTSRKDG